MNLETEFHEFLFDETIISLRVFPVNTFEGRKEIWMY